MDLGPNIILAGPRHWPQALHGWGGRVGSGRYGWKWKIPSLRRGIPSLPLTHCISNSETDYIIDNVNPESRIPYLTLGEVSAL